MSDDLRLHERVEAYFAARGVDVPVITTGEKAVEEAHELVAALASGDPQQIRNEVADVVIVAALVACQLGVTVGQCIDEKTRRDAGRGEGDHFDGRVLNAESRHAPGDLAEAWQQGFESDYEGDGWPPNPYRKEPS